MVVITGAEAALKKWGGGGGVRNVTHYIKVLIM